MTVKTKKPRFSWIYPLLFAIALTSACRHSNTTGVVVKESAAVQQEEYNPYVDGNKNIMRRENEEIEMFLKRYGLKMQRTGTGLYYKIWEEGSGETYRENDRVEMEYATFLLSGEEVYCSDSLGIKVFYVNRSEEIEALHEIAHLTRPGTTALLVIPSHLAYGVAGDGDRIAGLRPIIMKIHTLKTEKR